VKKIIFLILISFGFKVSADQFWIDPRSSIFSDVEVGPHIPAASFAIRDLNPGFRNGMSLYFADATATSAARSFKLAFFNSLGQRVCTDGQLSPAAPNECFYSASLFTQVVLTLSSTIHSVKIGSGCNQNCMSQLDEQNLFVVGTMAILVNYGQVKKICPSGQEISGPFFAGDHVVVSAQIEPGLTCEGSELWINNGDTKIGPTTTAADAGGLVKFDISSLPANTSSMNAYISGRNTVGQIKEIGSVGINFPGFINPTVYTTDIYQVIKNPILFAPSNVVDLVAGKNADIILETNLVQADITGTVLEWKNKSGGVEKVFPVKSNQTDATGKIIFEIDPVPKEYEYVGAETQFSIKLMLNNGCGSTSLAQTVTKTVHVRKTKPIKIGFVPISGCLRGVNQCFKGVTKQEAEIFRDHSLEILRAWYPVDNDVASRSFVYSADAMAESSFESTATGPNLFSAHNVQRDLVKLRIFRQNEYDHIVGVVDESYFKEFNNQISGIKGIANQPKGILRNDMPLIVVNDYYYALAHEIGHSYGLQHGTYASNGLNNYDLDSRWNFLRGQFLENKKSVMTAGPDLGLAGIPKFFTDAFWMYDQDYILLFRNLSDQPLTFPYKFFNLTTKRNDYFNFFKFLNIFEKKGSDLNNKKSRALNYNFSVLDKNRNQIYQGNATDYEIMADLQDSGLSEAPSDKLLDFEIPFLVDSVFISLSESVVKNSQTELFVLNTLLLQQRLNSIDNDAIITIDKSKIKSQLQSYINSYDAKMKALHFEDAEKIINKDIYPFLIKNLTDNYVPKTITTVGKNAFVQTATSVSINSRSLANTNNIISNGFLKVSEVYKDNVLSKIKLKKMTEPENKNFDIEFRVWLNSEEVKQAQDIGNNEYLIQGSLLPGQNNWVIKTYLVEAKLNRQILNYINQLFKQKADLQRKFDESGNFEEKEILNQQILQMSKKIDQAKNVQLENMSEVGYSIQKNILN
jgi:hypothetical protein